MQLAVTEAEAEVMLEATAVALAVGMNPLEEEVVAEVI